MPIAAHGHGALQVVRPAPILALHPTASGYHRALRVPIAARLARRPSAILAVVIGFGVVLPAVLAAATGNLAIPHNDAWAYSLIAERFAKTGSITLVGWNHPFSVGQEVTLGPLGSSVVAQQLLVVVLAVVALLATFFLLRTVLSPGRALFATAVVAAFPGFGLLATSFMEDIPTFCAIVGTLLIGRISITRRSFTGVALATVIGMWGVTTREQALAAVAGVLIAAFVAWTDRAMRTKLVLLCVVTIVGLVVLEAWRRSLANGQSPIVAFDLHGGANICVDAYFTLGLLTLPAVVAACRPRSWGRVAWCVAGLAAVLGTAFLVRYHSLILGNYLSWQGAYPIVLAGGRRVLPAVLWDALQVGAWIGGVVLAGAIADGVRRLDTTLLLFAVLTALGTVLEAFVGEPTFDRMMLPLLPIALILVLGVGGASVPRWRAVAAGGSLVGLFAISLAITSNALAFDVARWNAGKSLVVRGVKPQAIDVGFEWVGYHYPGPAVNVTPSKQRAGLPWYAQTLFPRAPECFVLTSSPVSGLGRLAETFSYRTYLAFGHSQLLLYSTGRCHGSS